MLSRLGLRKEPYQRRAKSYTRAMPSEETKRIIEILRKVPRGKVTSYGAVATLAGLPNGARQVVRILHSSAEKEDLPWFRILRKDGSIALPPGAGFELQRELLGKERVEVSREGKVDLAKYGWAAISERKALARPADRPQSRRVSMRRPKDS
jgi:methylated-DNA-protein-cysteine methyltransferase related protein